MTSHPKDLSDELIQTMAESQKICHHLHLPLQSGSSRVLKEMNRRYDKEKYLELVDKIRKAIPDISLTTDIMVGFPGETEEDFQETLDVVRKANYDTAFTFIYSKRSGTPAAGMENQVPEDVVKDRFSRLLTLVQEKGRENSSRFQGTIQEILVEDETGRRVLLLAVPSIIFWFISREKRSHRQICKSKPRYLQGILLFRTYRGRVEL